VKPRLAVAAAFCALVLLFLVANRGAYQGYFQDDELDNISWTPGVPLTGYFSALLSPRYSPVNFRPVGHALFGALGHYAGLRFPPYVAVIHTLHFAIVLLLWFLLRRLKLPHIAAGAGTVFFAFHMGAFDTLWKPMYVFDLLCTLFSLAAILAWTHRRWVVSFLAFWLAYKSKELAVMLPLLLAAYELWLSEETGRLRWLRLAPFFAVSLMFGLQAIVLRHDPNHAYRMEVSGAALAGTIPLYAARIFLIPYAGLAVLALPLITRDRRAWFGLACLLLFLAPLLILPGRVFSAYIYLPLAGLSIAAAAIAARAPAWSVGAFFLVWLPWNYHNLRLERRAALTIAQENQAYVKELSRVAAALPESRVFIYDGLPSAMASWGMQGALRFIYSAEISVFSIEDRDLAQSAAGKDVALLSWDPVTRKLIQASRRANEPPAGYVRMDRQTPVWQLLDGWLPRSGFFRWTHPVARAVLKRPEGAHRFELVANIGPPYIAAVQRGEVEVLLDGKSIGRAEFTREGWQTVGFDLAPAPASIVEVTFRAKPELRIPPDNPVALGLPVGAFGFPAPESRSPR
jgi:hypothetical protein